MQVLFITFLLVMSIPILGQESDNWLSYRDKKTELIGFKNSNGDIVISHKFMGFTSALIFEDIIAVMEDHDGVYESYYLTKSGKKVGVDSLFIADNSSDCENEGFIRFTDSKTGMTGMFDQNGKVIIPPIYDGLSKVHNGLIRGLKNSKKVYWDKHNELGCNHFSWEGGNNLLIDINNQTLIKDFEYKGKLDFYSVSVKDKPDEDSTKICFVGTNEKYYIFNDFEKEFNSWLNNKLIPNLTLKLLQESSMDSLIYWNSNTKNRVTEHKNEFLASKFEIINKTLKNTLLNSSEHFITVNGLNQFIHSRKNYSQYYNNCGEPRENKYPVLDLIINHEVDSELIQDHFEFLKTDNGYRLISLTISDFDKK